MNRNLWNYEPLKILFLRSCLHQVFGPRDRYLLTPMNSIRCTECNCELDRMKSLLSITLYSKGGNNYESQDIENIIISIKTCLCCIIFVWYMNVPICMWLVARAHVYEGRTLDIYPSTFIFETSSITQIEVY